MGGTNHRKKMPRSEFPIFKVDKKKVVESILFLLDNFVGFSQYDIVKTIFLADKSHLTKYGRPITFDTYYAMEHGPVPTFTYDVLKPLFDFQREFGEERPWISVPDARNSKMQKFVGARRKPRNEYLSETDRELLKEAGGAIQLLDFEQIRRLTHEDEAYKEAWQRRGKSERSQIKMELLGVDKKLIEDLIYISNHAS
ncbi:MAG TPA: Panacea domain-containing protein [Rhizomicrobium sp.]|nr:Panacea domain-containing protein [Rhizomicrobium sp.]